MKKIAVVTGSRAEYGLLRPIIKKLHEASDLKLQLLVTSMHLSPEFGLTYKEIEKDGFPIEEKIETLLSSDTAIGISKSIGLGTISFAEAFERLKPDMVIILGDRYEMLAVATAAMVAHIPIAHIHGGELTEGVMDEAIRHSITKMSILHFTSTESYRKRVIQLGENPKHVFNVGALGVENIKSLELLSQTELEKRIHFSLEGTVAMVTFHPVPIKGYSVAEQFTQLLNTLNQIENLKVIFTKSNADRDGRIINQMIDNYVNEHPSYCIAFTSMGQLNYLSVLQYVSIIIGNSSSGLIEVPSFRKPTVNIGDRQEGRVVAKSVINCNCIENEIIGAIKKGLSHTFNEKIKSISNPYEKENTSDMIIKEIKNYLKNYTSVKKKFYDL